MLQVKVKASTIEQLTQLHKFNIDFKEHTMRLDPDISHYEVMAIVSDKQKMKLESVGYRVDVISDLARVARERLEEVSRINRFSEVQDMAKLREFAFAGGYMNVDEVETVFNKTS